MSLYEDRVLPHVINLACGSPAISRNRQKWVQMAEGRVLEVGMGSGLNIRHYNPNRIEFVWGLEPSEGMRKKAQKNLQAAPFEVRWVDLPGEEIPMDDNTVDTVLLTYTLCTIPDWRQALAQMRRVLKPGGRLIFCEHGAAPDAAVRQWQERINPVWKKVAGGCHLNRPILDYIRESGFSIGVHEAEYMPKTPRIAGFNYAGVARAR